MCFYLYQSYSHVIWNAKVTFNFDSAKSYNSVELRRFRARILQDLGPKAEACEYTTRGARRAVIW